MVRVYVMTGIPGSGKSTLVARRKSGELKFREDEKIPNSKLITVISRDAIRLKINGSDINKDNMWNYEPLVIKEYYKQIRQACFQYLEIFCDATHLTISSRRRLLNTLRDLKDAGKVIFYSIFVNTPVEECIARDAKRQGIFSVGEKDIKAMAARLVIPNENEGFEKVYII